MVAETTLIELDDRDFDWLGRPGIPGPIGLRVPAEGVDDAPVLAIIRRIVARLHQSGSRGAWMIVSGDTAVGLCSFKHPPGDGEVEIGYGVARRWREKGHATRAIAALVEIARGDPTLLALTAETAITNPASAKVLERNGFIPIGTRQDEEEGDLVSWRLTLR